MTWLRVVHASDCVACECCAEPFCPVCAEHYADCDCPGPTQDDEYEYETNDVGTLMARRIIPEEDE